MTDAELNLHWKVVHFVKLIKNFQFQIQEERQRMSHSFTSQYTSLNDGQMLRGKMFD